MNKPLSVLYHSLLWYFVLFVDVIIGMVGNELFIKEFIFDGFMLLTLGAFGITTAGIIMKLKNKVKEKKKMKITKTGDAGIEMIKTFEGFRSAPYKCPAGIPTIGYGATFYPNGKKVTMADKAITEAEAVELLKHMLVSFEKYVDSYCRDDINQNQFDALVSFVYNLGPANLKSSTLLKKVNANPEDETIAAEFMQWVKAGGKTLKGLVRRREAESQLYFKK